MARLPWKLAVTIDAVIDGSDGSSSALSAKSSGRTIAVPLCSAAGEAKPASRPSRTGAARLQGAAIVVFDRPLGGQRMLPVPPGVAAFFGPSPW